jgi:hypothetical protein
MDWVSSKENPKEGSLVITYSDDPMIREVRRYQLYYYSSKYPFFGHVSAWAYVIPPGSMCENKND